MSAFSLHDPRTQSGLVAGVPPLLGATVGLDLALALGLGLAIVAAGSRTACLLAWRRLAPPGRAVLTLIVAGGLTAALLTVGLALHYDMTRALGVYLPLLAVNPAAWTVALRPPDQAVAPLRDVVLGTALIAIPVAICVAVAAMRALAPIAPVLTHPASALLLAGGGVALWQWRCLAHTAPAPPSPSA